MGAANLTGERIRAAVVKHWSDQFTATPNVLTPGGRLDTAGIDEWVSVGVESWARPAQRRTGKDFRNVIVVVHCWAKFGTNQARAVELADAAVAILDHARWEVRDYDDSAEPLVGRLLLFEAEVVDLSRRDQDRLVTDSQHLVVRVTGLAAEV
jgi:hypothetical protein